MVDLKRDLGLNIPNHEDNPTSREAAYVEAMQKHSLGKNLKGEDVNLTEAQSKYLYKESLKAKNDKWYKVGFNSDYHAAYKSFQNDVERGKGNTTWRAGNDLGNGLGKEGHNAASRWGLVKSGIYDSTKIIGEALPNTLGIATKQQRRQYQTSGFLGKLATGGAVGLGAYSIISSGLTGGDMYDTVTDNLSLGAGTVGFHVGNKFAGALQGTKMVNGKLVGGKRRMAFSTVGGIAGGAIFSQAVGGITKAAKDLTTSDSGIVRAVKGESTLPGGMTATMQNDKTLTMRQKALQQISQSSMNDRGTILGSEASILRGYA